MKAVAVLALAALLGAVQAKPVNSTCPVKGTPVNPAITTDYKGKTIGFC